MSHYDYEMSRHIGGQGWPFYALIMAAMRQVDTDNTEKLRAAWPDVYYARYHAPGGLLDSDPRPAR